LQGRRKTMNPHQRPRHDYRTREQRVSDYLTRRRYVAFMHRRAKAMLSFAPRFRALRGQLYNINSSLYWLRKQLKQWRNNST